MKVTLNISELKSEHSANEEYPATPAESIELIPIGKSGIHIKKKNRGSFTSYCGGKVTDACIQKAKNSPSSAIRKKAVFAENARGWARKHQEGGTLSHTPGIKLNKNLSDLFVSYDTDFPEIESTGLQTPKISTIDLEELNPVGNSESTAEDNKKAKAETQTTGLPSWITTPYEFNNRSQAPASLFGPGASSSLMASVNKYLGIPFKLGGDGIHTTDCSKFVSSVIGNMGFNLKGNCRTLWSGTSRIDTSDLQPGDLVFLQDTQLDRGVKHGQASHVGIVVDTSKLGQGIVGVAHAQSDSGTKIVNWNLGDKNSYYGKRYLGAGRLTTRAKLGGILKLFND